MEKGEGLLADPESLRFIRSFVYVTELQEMNSLPLKIVEKWPQASSLDGLVESGVFKTHNNSVQLDLQVCQEIIEKKLAEKIGLEFPVETQKCLGPPWNGSRRVLVKCRPRLEDIMSGRNREIQPVMSNYVHRIATGKGHVNVRPRPLDNVIVIPSLHQGDHYLHPKIKRAIEYYDPDFVGIEAIGPAGTRYLASTLPTARNIIGLPYCVYMKPYTSIRDRIEFFTQEAGESNSVKACITPEGDFATIASICLVKGIPFFPFGVPEECIESYIPGFFEIERTEWQKSCKDLENEARCRMMLDLDCLCRQSRIGEMEEVVLAGRVKTSEEYKRILLWSEDYMISRIYDFCVLVSPDVKIVVFVGLCHSKTMRNKIRYGTWRYIPPIDERVTPIPLGFMPSKIAGYVQLYDPGNEGFMNRFARSFAPSGMYAELFELDEKDVINFTKQNLRTAVVVDEKETKTSSEIAEAFSEFLKGNPSRYQEILEIFESYYVNNEINKPDDICIML